MSALSPSTSSRLGKATRQNAMISGHVSDPIHLSPLTCIQTPRRYLEELVLGSGPSDIVIDSMSNRDSVTQLMAACQGGDLNLKLANVLEIEFLCDEWSVHGKSIRKKLSGFIEHGPGGQGLWLRRLLFRLSRCLESSKAEAPLRSRLVDFVGESAAFEIPAAVVPRIVDRRAYESRSDAYDRLFQFCFGHLSACGTATSMIFSHDDLGCLCSLNDLNSGVLNVSVCRL
jgi:hypothetical protein